MLLPHRWLARLAIVGLLPVVAGGALWLRLEAAEEALAPWPEGVAPAATSHVPTEILIPVRGTRVVRGPLRLTVEAAAEAAAWRDATLWANAAGRVIRMPVREADAVREGQELLAIDATEARLGVHEALANLERARLSYRELTLLDDRITNAELRAERRRLARVRADLDAAEVRVERAELTLSRTVLRAPFDGRVASIEARVGDWVRTGDSLMRVLEIDPIRVEVQALDSEVRWLRRGGAAEVDFAALPGETFAGWIESVNPDVDRELRTVRVSIVVRNPEGRVLPGMYARARLHTRELPDRLLVPRAAVLERDHRAMIFVYDGDERGGHARWRWVMTGDGNEHVVELIEAEDSALVEPGDIVLTGGHVSLIHDARVRLVDDTTSLDETRPE
ncbi:MAG TPA: efflux RND transporter periplasmic adaptor subunit [Longimicrobiales bacterium]|nr:efflux RND transporter periplasmic adaptor subunit [Longimicrobiales bacterium]